MKKATFIFGFVLIYLSSATLLPAAEPNMADYTAEPVFMINSVQPNIMIILDNSGSMNYNAYGSYPGNDGLVTDGAYTGEPYNGSISLSIATGVDDVEENKYSRDQLNTGSNDVDLAGFSTGQTNSIVGLRFQKLPIKKGATISEAYIEFTSRYNHSEDGDHYFEGLAYDNVSKFSTSLWDDLSKRAGTTNRVEWDDVPDWVDQGVYKTPDLKSIVQEIVNRNGWKEGNAIAFRITGSGKRSAYTFNSNPNKAARLIIKTADSTPTRYYGYFNPDYFYSYGSSKFTHAYKKVVYDSSTNTWKVTDLSGNTVALNNSRITSENLWDGNFANWVSMRRIDILRKVLMGGLATSRTGGGNQTNYGETPAQSYRRFTKRFDSSSGPQIQVSPFSGNYYYGLSSGKIYVSSGTQTPWTTSSSDTHTIAVQKNDKLEPEDFFKYDTGSNLAGILQKVGEKARWGNIYFNDGGTHSGGTVGRTMGVNMVNLGNDLQNRGANTSTPLAETYYVARQYFKQEDPQSGLGYPNNAVPNANAGDDPFNVNGIQVPCVKNFVILLTDGASTKDARIPNDLKDWDKDGDLTGCDDSSSDDTVCDYPGGGTDYLDDIALNARQVDLRSDIEGHQELILYTVYSFGSEESARSLLMDAARNGGFNDMDGDRTPDGTYTDPANMRREWDKDGDEIPDTYFEASDGYELEKRLLSAIMSILQRAAAGSSASVLATNSEGEGTMIQAYFRQSITGSNGVDEARWLGFIQSLWIDPWGFLREDTDGDGHLDLYNSAPGNTAVDVDRIVSYKVTDIDTMVDVYTSHYLYNPDNNENITCTLGAAGSTICTPIADTDDLESIRPVFEAGERLSQRDSDTRKIFTFIDKSNNGVVDEATASTPYDVTDEVITFDTGTATEIKPFLGIKDDTIYSFLGADHDTRVTNLITFIRGTDVAGLRNRTLDGVTYKLGDVIHSTPVSITGAGENYHLIYSDKSYQTFLDAMKDRETMVYVGANDGMLHAFTSWKYDITTHGFKDPYPSDTASATTFIPDEKLGDEVWAFIPQTLLPHLKWYSDPEYIHSYYVDLKPKIFDAKILPDETHYTDTDTDPNWGTFLIGGLRHGGKEIWAEGDFGSGNETRNFYPTYFCMDITDPRNPRLLWERSYDNLSFSASDPGIIKVGDSWYVTFGSGPTDYEGKSTQSAYFYVVDLKTGKPYSSGANDWIAGPLESKAFVNSPVSFDKGLNYNVDGIYYGISYFASNKWQGKVYKLGVPCTTCSYDAGFNPFTDTVTYDTDPTNWFNVELFESPRPITAPLALSLDKQEQLWTFFGTGRYISKVDKTDTSQQYLYGVKDPFFNTTYKGTFFHSTTTSKALKESDIFTGADDIAVTTSRTVLDGNNLYGGHGQWAAFLDDMRKKDGWRISLDPYVASGSERVVSKPAVLGGTVFTPTLIPNEDVCGLGGDSNLYAVYYETGTGFIDQALYLATKEYVTVDGKPQEKVSIKLPERIEGAPPPRIGLHVGMETDYQFDGQQGDSGRVGSAYLQQSTGQIVNLRIKTALRVRSGLLNWREIN